MFPLHFTILLVGDNEIQKEVQTFNRNEKVYNFFLRRECSRPQSSNIARLLIFSESAAQRIGEHINRAAFWRELTSHFAKDFLSTAAQSVNHHAHDLVATNMAPAIRDWQEAAYCLPNSLGDAKLLAPPLFLATLCLPQEQVMIKLDLIPKVAP